MMERLGPLPILELMRRFGIWQLADDAGGCACTGFEINYIHVQVSCRSSEHTVRVYSHSMERDTKHLELVADEVVRQLTEHGHLGFRVRFCEYSYDHVDGKRIEGVWHEWWSCCYCGKTRESQEAYLCKPCQSSASARSYYPWDGSLEASLVNFNRNVEVLIQ